MPYAHQFSVLADHLQLIISQGGYALLFLFTLLEGIPVLGMAVPGHVSIIIAGFLARLGALNLYWVMAISTVGAVLGDFIGFCIGRTYGLSFIDRVRPYFFITDAHIEKAHALLAAHTGKAMVIGRFTPATRALMPFLVGTSHTPAGRFWLFNLIGGISWVVVSVMAGYVFGVGYHAFAAYIGRFIMIAVIGIVVIIWGYRFVNTHYHVFRRYELFTLILNLLSLGALALMIQDAVSAHPFMVNFDIAVSSYMNLHNQGSPFNAALAGSAAWLSEIGGTAVLAGLGVMLTAWFSLRKKWRSAAIVLLTLASTSVLLGVMKEFFGRARPENALQTLTDYSFPSGHSGMAAAFFVVVAYLFAPKIRSWVRRESLLVVCVLAAIAIGLSRLILNVHWASDVIAGWALGTFLATASILLVRYVGMLFKKKIESQTMSV